VGLEIVAQAKATDIIPDAVVVPCGGGGLTAGVAIAVTDGFPGTEVWGVAVVSDAEAVAAVREAMLSLKLVVEPGGAVGLAALLSGKIPVAGRTVVVVLSGGNVDPAA